ncbi:MAG: CDP-archaeol synthase [Clostridia bacterium]|nr:CDP-archaeol synthase [Clostridia bacterium]
MKNRVISGTLYVAVLLAFFLAKIFIPHGDLIFDALIYAFAVIGTFEMVRAMGKGLARTEKTIVFCFSAVCIPACAVSEYLFGYGIHVTAVCFFALAIVLLSLLVFKNEESSLENIGTAFVSAVYPTLLLCLLVLANHFGENPIMDEKYISGATDLQAMKFDSKLAILFIFFISPISDAAAFFTGLSLKKKFPKKLAPKLSPNKTVVGFVGGLIGGMIGGAIIYFVYNAIYGDFTHMYIWLPVYVAVGLFASLATAFGDLVESCIKRQRGLKDMGDLMPGHGGILDRIDGTLFATVAVYVSFTLIALIAI